MGSDPSSPTEEGQEDKALTNGKDPTTMQADQADQDSKPDAHH